MKTTLTAMLLLLPLAAAGTVSTYAEVAALVAATETGDVAVEDAVAEMETSPDAPLAGPACGTGRPGRNRTTPHRRLACGVTHRGATGSCTPSAAISRAH